MKNSYNILAFTALTMSLTTTAFATEQHNHDVATAYVDSVHQWGAWELDIEPAAGGLQQPSTQALKARDSKAKLRTNSFSALAPPAPSPIVITQLPASAPIPVVHAIPQPPVSAPIPVVHKPHKRPVTPAIGGPADFIF